MRQHPALGITGRALASAVIMALAAFAVSNFTFAQQGEVTMSVFYIRTLVDLAGVLVLSVQQEQLREARLHQELEGDGQRAAPPVRAVPAKPRERAADQPLLPRT